MEQQSEMHRRLPIGPNLESDLTAGLLVGVVAGWVVFACFAWWGVAVALACFLGLRVIDRYGWTQWAREQVAREALSGRTIGTPEQDRPEGSEEFYHKMALFLCIPDDRVRDELLLTPDGLDGLIVDFFCWEHEYNFDELEGVLDSMGLSSTAMTVGEALRVYNALRTPEESDCS